jgi:hypothetical protein
MAIAAVVLPDPPSPDPPPVAMVPPDPGRAPPVAPVPPAPEVALPPAPLALGAPPVPVARIPPLPEPPVGSPDVAPVPFERPADAQPSANAPQTETVSNRIGREPDIELLHRTKVARRRRKPLIIRHRQAGPPDQASDHRIRRSASAGQQVGCRAERRASCGNPELELKKDDVQK